MKRTFFLLLCCLVLLLSGCGVSQADYDALAEEKSSLQTRVEELQSEVELLSSENETLESEKQALEKEYLDYQTEQVLAELDDSYGVAWATTSFGADTICLTSDDGLHFQCLASDTYKISDAGISALWSDLIESVTTLAIISENINYETISIKFYDPTGINFLEYSLKKKNGSYTLDTINCNVLYADQIISSIAKLSTK